LRRLRYDADDKKMERRNGRKMMRVDGELRRRKEEVKNKRGGGRRGKRTLRPRAEGDAGMAEESLVANSLSSGRMRASVSFVGAKREQEKVKRRTLSDPRQVAAPHKQVILSSSIGKW
jgi:hypothetical protein